MQTCSRLPSKRPHRVGELACLPVFFNLSGRRAMIVGGTDAAAWKAELLAACGADVQVVALASELGEEMAGLLANGAAAGSLRHLDCAWPDADFSGAAVVVADICASEAEALIAKARAAAVPVNVIDKPAFCDFQFGSIVNRSPVVVGISTNGAAPILGQAVRRRIESVLPNSLASWGRVASELRGAVMARLKQGAQRRRFWQNLADSAFGDALPDPGDMEQLIDLIAAADRPDGKVTIIRVGQGGADALILKDVRVLQSADAIFYDQSISEDVLELARREARRHFVTETDRATGLPGDVRGEMRRLARSGMSVAWLKSVSEARVENPFAEHGAPKRVAQDRQLEDAASF